MLRLIELRKSKLKTQMQMAQILGISRQAYANYEAGNRAPDYETLKKLADFFDVTVDYLIGRTSKDSSVANLSKREIDLIQKYRNNPQMQPAVDTLLGIAADELEDVYEIPVAARSGKIGKATSSYTEEERKAALESEFPGVFEEKE